MNFRTAPPPCAKPRRETHDAAHNLSGPLIDQLYYIHSTNYSRDNFTMSDDEDGPPMLVSSENVGDAEEATLNAEMADAQVKKVPISIITGQLSFHLLTSVLLLCGNSTCDVLDTITIQVGPVPQDQVQNYIPRAKNIRMIKQLNRYFMPLFFETEIVVHADKSKFKLSSFDIDAVRLGMNTYL